MGFFWRPVLFLLLPCPLRCCVSNFKWALDMHANVGWDRKSDSSSAAAASLSFFSSKWMHRVRKGCASLPWPCFWDASGSLLEPLPLPPFPTDHSRADELRRMVRTFISRSTCRAHVLLCTCACGYYLWLWPSCIPLFYLSACACVPLCADVIVLGLLCSCCVVTSSFLVLFVLVGEESTSKHTREKRNAQ